MSHKLQRMLVSTMNRVVSVHISKGPTYVIKQNFCCSNQLWKCKMLPIKSMRYHSVLYENRFEFHESKANSSEVIEANKKKGELIYFGIFTSRITGLKVVSYSSSLLGLGIQAMIFKEVTAMAVPAMIALFSVLGFFTFVTPFMIHFVTKKYVTEIKYHSAEDVYTAKTMTFFFQEKIERFKLENVKYDDSASLFNTFFFNGKPFILFEAGFLNKEHYIKFLGFDKPIDLKLGNGNDDVCEGSTITSVKEK